MTTTLTSSSALFVSDDVGKALTIRWPLRARRWRWFRLGINETQRMVYERPISTTILQRLNAATVVIRQNGVDVATFTDRLAWLRRG